MPNIGKIEKYGLESEVLSLHKRGIGVDAIADVIRSRYPENQDFKKLSGMSIHRFLQTHKTQTIKKKLATGESDDILEELLSDFRDNMYSTINDTNSIWKIMKKALQRVITEGDDFKTIKAAKDTLNAMEQTRKNWMTLIQYGVDQFNTKEQAKEINIVEINNFLIDATRDLCPECRKKLVDEILKKEKEYSHDRETKKIIEDLVKK